MYFGRFDFRTLLGYNNERDAEVAEWQTRRSQKPLRATSCGFDSHLRHQPSPSCTDHVGAWLSLVERSVRVAEVGGSNPLAPTRATARSSIGLSRTRRGRNARGPGHAPSAAAQVSNNESVRLPRHHHSTNYGAGPYKCTAFWRTMCAKVKNA